jgi:hypothetical protein
MLAINNIKENLALIQAQYPRVMHPVLTESEVQIAKVMGRVRGVLWRVAGGQGAAFFV